MKYLLLLFLILGLTTKVNAQQLLAKRECVYPLNPKMMNTLVYHTPHHESPKLKFTFKSAINKSSIQKMEGDELQLSQIANYNIREIIENSELHYTAGKIIDSESFEMMVNKLVEKLSGLVTTY